MDYLTKQKAEEFSGIKLDGRRRYFLWAGEVCVNVKHTRECSGCDGGGCHECGYCGKRVEDHPLPVEYL